MFECFGSLCYLAVIYNRIFLLGTEKVVQNGETGNRPVGTTKPSAQANTDQTVSHPSHCHAQGTVLTLGQGDCGQLGLGDSFTERKKPFPVRGELEGKRMVQVVCGGMHTVALTDDGKVGVVSGCGYTIIHFEC